MLSFSLFSAVERADNRSLRCYLKEKSVKMQSRPSLGESKAFVVYIANVLRFSI